MSITFRRATLMIALLLAVLAGTLPQASAQTEADAPKAVVEALYTQYLAAFADVNGEPGFPEQGWYRDSALLTEDFIAAIDAFMADDSMETHYDPFLCAQNIPTAFSVDEPVIAEDGLTASAVVRTDFMGYHAFEVQLALQDESWLINAVNCGTVERDPAGVVKNFYLIYLAYTAPDSQGDRRNFMVDRVYRYTDLLSDAFVAALDDMLESDGHLAADPLICAQDVPETITVVDTAIEDATARVEVETSFAGHGFTVALEQIEDVWFISGIACQAR